MALGIDIIGVGFAQPEVNEAWGQQQEYDFELWTDDNRELVDAYGAMADFDFDYDDGRWARNTWGYMLEYYSETAVLRRLCRSTEAAIQQCRSFEEFEAGFDRPDLHNWERLANF